MEAELAKLRELALDLLERKGTGINSSDVKKATSNGLLQIMRIKEASKKLSYHTEEQKEETSKSKQQLEQGDLQLQNLLYEKQYYEKEIRSCRAFQSQFSDEQLGLMPVEEFLASIDEQTRQKALSSDHQQMKERLVHEAKLRKKLIHQLDELKATKSSLFNAMLGQRSTLDDLKRQLKSLEDGAKPLQNVLGPHLTLRISNRTADLLPLPLYIVYCHLAAAKEALGLPLTVKISGSVDDADSFARSQAADNTEQAETSSRNPEAEGSAGKRPRLSPAPADDLYKMHPLTVELEIQPEGSSSSAPLMLVKFQYLLSLRLAAASCGNSADNQLLGSLFPADDGSTLPSEAAAQLHGGSIKYNPAQLAKPYRWCQHLAGLDFVPPLPVAGMLQGAEYTQVMDGLETPRRQQRVVTLINRLRAVKEANAALNALMANLLKNATPADTSMYPRMPQTTIASWEEISNIHSSLNQQSRMAATAPATATATATAPAATSSGSGLRGASPALNPGGPSSNNLQALGAEETMRMHVLASLGVPYQATRVTNPTGLDPQAMRSILSQLQDGLDEGEVREQPAASPAPMPEGAEGTQPPGAEAPAAMEVDDAAEPAGTLPPGPGMHEEELMLTSPLAGYLGNAFQDDQDDDQLYDGAAYTETLEDDSHNRAEEVPEPKPPSRLFRLVLRSPLGLELEASVRVFLDYPARAPLVLVRAIREVPKDRKAQGKEVEAGNQICWLEQEANLDALAVVPRAQAVHTLLYQITHLRLCMDEVAAQYSGENSKTKDLQAILARRQKLRGRDRRVPAVALMA